MGSTKRMSKEQLKDALRGSLKSIIDEPDQDEFLQYEMQVEMDAQQKVFDALNNEEKDRWDHIIQLLEKKDNSRIAKFNGIELQETERVNAYFKASLMSTNEFEEYLINMIRECNSKISKYSFGRELLENFSNEKFLLLFVDGDRYSPLNLFITEYYEEKDEREIKDKLIKAFARKNALLNILKNLDNSLPINLHLKDVTKSDAHYESIIKTLLDECIIYEIGEGKYSFKRSKQFSVRDLAHFINSLYSFGFLKFEISKEQGITISKNTFGYEYSTGYAGETDFMPKQYERLKNLILSNLLNISK
jgi:hypothetical protein